MSNRKDQANAYREARGYPGGYVVFFGDEITDWALDFPRPEAYVAGCIAVDVVGNEWVSLGGNDYDGAEGWDAMVKEDGMNSLQEWIEAALIVANAEGMDDEQVIPTWPEDVAEKFPALTVGALRAFNNNSEADEQDKECVMDALAESLGEAYDCTRVWSAWSYGTMTQDDFSLVGEDAERLGELADAAISAMAKRRAES